MDESKKWEESIFNIIMAENFPFLQRDLDIEVHEAHKSPVRFNPERSSPTCIVIKLTKIEGKERILKETTRKKHHMQWNFSPRPHKTINIYLRRNLAGYGTVG